MKLSKDILENLSWIRALHRVEISELTYFTLKSNYPLEKFRNIEKKIVRR